jgi:hypothetical protein
MIGKPLEVDSAEVALSNRKGFRTLRRRLDEKP